MWGVLVTYRRPEALTQTLAAIGRQNRAVDGLVVVDNGSDCHARAAAAAVGAMYIDAHGNQGPAGGIALGMQHILRIAADEDWLVLFDDDDPPRTDEILEQLWNFGQVQCRSDSRTGAVGLVGARYDARRGVTRRVRDEELDGPVPVDYIGGGQFPMFRCVALKRAGVFDRRLFFGFDDLEHGLRLRRAGYSLYADGDLWLVERRLNKRTGLDKSRLRTPRDAAAWRRYYSVRNTGLIAREYASPATAVFVALGGGAKGVMALVRARRPAIEWVMPLRGAVDAVMGLSGRRVDPGLAHKTGGLPSAPWWSGSKRGSRHGLG